MDFEWDEQKANANAVKHGVTFEEAKTVFADDFAAILTDTLHSENELRTLIIGYSAQNRLLFVSYTERGDAVRLISARTATKREHEKHERETNFG